MHIVPTTFNPTLPPPAPTPYQAISVPKRTRHGFHIWMSIFTAGAWLPVWGICALLNAGKTRTVWVTR